MRRALALACVLWPGLVRAQEASYGAAARVRSEAPPEALRIDVAQGGQRPGAFGEPARALLDLPGVARGGFFGAELSVWGATTSEARIYVDGAEIPWFFHTGGLRAAVHPALLDTLQLTPSAPRADFGRGTGPVLELGLVSEGSRGVHAKLNVDAIDSGLALRAGSQRVFFTAALRQGYFDRVLRGLAPESAGVVRVPSHADGGARLVFRARERVTWSLAWLGADERTRLRQSERSEQLDRHTQTLIASYDRRYADGARVRITPFAGLDGLRDARNYGGVPLRQEERDTRVGLRAIYELPGRVMGLRVGLDTLLTQAAVARSGTFTLPPREGDVFLFGQAPVSALGDERYRATTINLAPHLGLPLRLYDLTIEPALRLDTYAIASSRSTPASASVPALGLDHFHAFVDPRVQVQWRVIDSVTPYFSAGVRHAPPSSSDLGPVFGNPRLPPSRAREAVLGTRAKLPGEITVDSAAFVRGLDHLAVRSSRVPPALSEALRATGAGRAYGVQTMLACDAVSGVFGQLAYTLSRSERTDPDGSYRRFDLDQTHLLGALLGYRVAKTRVSARMRYATGSPRTRVIGAYEDVTSGDPQPLFGRHNRARNPAFAQLDLHADQRIDLGEHSFTLSLDVLNVTNRENVELVAYGASFATRRDVRGLPALVYAGLAWEY